MERECCREGTVAPTDDDDVPLRKFSHVCRHSILEGLWSVLLSSGAYPFRWHSAVQLTYER